MFQDQDLDLEEQANRLLKEASALGRRSGVYTEEQLKRHAYRDIISTELTTSSMAVANTELTELVVGELQHLGRVAGLTDLQQDAWNLRILGLDIPEIATVCQVSPGAIRQRLDLARFKVIKAMVNYPYFGLWEVYYQLIRRK